MPTAYCLLPTAYCLLPTAYCLLVVPREDRLPRAPFGRQHASALADVRLVLPAEQLHRRQHRRRGRVAERTQCLAGDVARDAEQQVKILRLSLAAFDALQQLQEPVRALAARRTLAARFVPIEIEQVH